jgi:hypothetical protein
MLCGNEQTGAQDRIGPVCRKLIKGPLANAFRFWKECGKQNTKCCGGISGDHIYFHGKHWDAHYQPQGMPELSTDVEMGVSFFNDHATTYYIFDADSFSESFGYGETLKLPQDPTNRDFWLALDKQLDKAAEAAWRSDILSCPKCGYHYNASVEPCPCEETEEEYEEENNEKAE